MYSQKIFLFAAIVLAMVSIADAELTLTINGLDATKPMEIKGKENLVIAVAGASEAKAQEDLSVTCDIGKLEPLKKPDKYLFAFAGESGVGTISLNVNKELVYQLVLLYVPEKDTVIVFGVGKEALAESQSQPEPKLQPQLEQQITFSQTTSSEKSFFSGMSGVQTAGLDGFPDPNLYPDLDSNDMVNFIDFAIFADNWQKSGSGLAGDFDDSGAVDTNDLATLAFFWLSGPPPLDVFESFKAALAAGEVNEALTYIAEISREKYAEIFQIIEPNLPDYAAGMGELIFDWQRSSKVKYEMLHQNGPQTLSFPVFFIREGDGNWRIFNL